MLSCSSLCLFGSLLTAVFLEPLVSGSLSFGVLVSPDEHMIWILLGNAFCFVFVCLLVDTVHASVFGGLMVLSPIFYVTVDLGS